ncbi:exodeoxyribonuclease I [Halomonas halocynthiae]|uniref:exodeoxyribonuclease I n=1 Tax=Halomonas halocynthiae TaxID=176290 RepID=UPI00041EB4BA|nr:exodeoxyribonuclease I [Halomonas halocynthiae]
MAPPTKPVSFLWHDYETFGIDTQRDRPVQFAAIRTDAELNEISEPVELFCRPSDDFLPHPQACLVTGITPQRALHRGIPEAEFANRICEEMSQPGTCSVGYNSLRFDDEVSRHLFYRNLIDPYAREWQNGNSRWDLIDVVRAFHALRPEGIEWPRREDGSPSFRLEELTQANGIAHEGAHDAVADVRATIALARRLKTANPRLFSHLLNQRGKRQIAELLDITAQVPVLHVSRRYPASRNCAALVMPLAKHPTNSNGVIVYDLSVDPQPMLELSAEQIQQRVFISNDELAEGESRIPLKVIHINKCPIVMPVAFLKDVDGERAGDYGRIVEQMALDLEAGRKHWKALRAAPEITERVKDVFSKPYPEPPRDPDLMLYSGNFFSPSDRAQMERVRASAPWDLVGATFSFQDPRLEEMLFRFRARSYPETLEGDEKERWENWRWERLRDSQVAGFTLSDFGREIEQLGHQELTDSQRQVLEELVMYVESILPSQAFD